MSAREDEGTDVNIEEGEIEGKVTIFNGNNKGYPWMVYISTCVAVCGSYQFGACVCPSSFFDSIHVQRDNLTPEFA